MDSLTKDAGYYEFCRLLYIIKERQRVYKDQVSEIKSNLDFLCAEKDYEFEKIYKKTDIGIQTIYNEWKNASLDVVFKIIKTVTTNSSFLNFIKQDDDIPNIVRNFLFTRHHLKFKNIIWDICAEVIIKYFDSSSSLASKYLKSVNNYSEALKKYFYLSTLSDLSFILNNKPTTYVYLNIHTIIKCNQQLPKPVSNFTLLSTHTSINKKIRNTKKPLFMFLGLTNKYYEILTIITDTDILFYDYCSVYNLHKNNFLIYEDKLAIVESEKNFIVLDKISDFKNIF